MRQYRDLLRRILKEGVHQDDRTGVGTRSVFGHQMRFGMQDGFPLLTDKEVNFASIVHELLWMIKGDTNIKYLVDNGVNIWTDWPLKQFNHFRTESKGLPTWTKQEFTTAIRSDAAFAEQWGDLGPVYGAMWRRWPCGLFEKGAKSFPIEYDQLGLAIELLKENPASRRIIVNSWNPPLLSSMALPPCHLMYQFGAQPLSDAERRQLYMNSQYTDCPLPTHKLNLHLTQRSADVFLGLPYNIASYSLLLQMVAQVVNMVPDEFVWTGVDVHLYENHLTQAEELLQRHGPPPPSLRLNEKISSIDDFKFEDITLEAYRPLPPIKAPVAV